MTLNELNQLSVADATDVISQCCAAERWVQGVVNARPFTDVEQLIACADSVWAGVDEPNLLQAFSAHPQIGNVDTLRAKYANTKAVAAGEQSGVQEAAEATLLELARLNHVYLERFGFIFIVCATGKSAAEMLELLQARVDNTRDQELINAAEEQRKITALRLRKLF